MRGGAEPAGRGGHGGAGAGGALGPGSDFLRPGRVGSAESLR